MLKLKIFAGIIHAVVPTIVFSFSTWDGVQLGLCHERALDVAHANDLRTIVCFVS